MQTPQPPSPSAARHRNAPPPPQSVLLEELIAEILSWLPVKSLLRFSTVCKSWKSLISDSNFVKQHLRRSARNANMLLMWERVNHYTGDLDLYVVPCSVRYLLENPSLNTIAEDKCYRLNDSGDYYVVGSCNGLVCWVDDLYGKGFREYEFNLWNPATKLRYEKLAYLCVGDCFSFSFGYDNLSDTYKVLAFGFDTKGKAKEGSLKIQVKICSLGDGSWRDLQNFPVVPFPDALFPGQNDGAYLNGYFNWLAFANINSDDYRWNNTITIAQMVIVSLDLGTETYSQMLLPSLGEAPQAEPTIGVLKDCLCFSHDYKRSYFVVWQMKEYGVQKSWTRFMKVSYDDLQIDCLDFPFAFPLIPLCMSENDDIVVMAISNKGESQGIIYNQRDNRAKQAKLPKYIGWNDTKDYVESLVSPSCN